MIKVFVLITIAASYGFTQNTVTTDVAVFESVDDCLRHADFLKKDLRKKYNLVEIRCEEKTVFKRD